MKITRRQFLKGAMIAGCGTCFAYSSCQVEHGSAHAFYQSPEFALRHHIARRCPGDSGCIAGSLAGAGHGVTHYVMASSSSGPDRAP